MTTETRAAYAGRDSAVRPQVGSLVLVRGQQWMVEDTEDTGQLVLDLQSIEPDRFGQTLTVVWDVEVGAAVVDAGALPGPEDLDPPATLAAFLDAARWSSATSADIHHLQAPFRSGVVVESYQLEPLARAVTAPRVNLLLADDVGLGKTIEAGLVVQELLLRHRARRVMIVSPAGLTQKWRDEMSEKFGLDFVVVDAAECARLRRVRGSTANPFRVHPYVIVSLPWLRGPRGQRLLAQALPARPSPLQRTIDILVLDEAHHVAPAAPKQRYAVDSLQTKAIRALVPHCEHKLFLSATPHNGYPESFTALLELIDNQRFARGVTPDSVAQRETVIRRLKRDVTANADGTAFLPREMTRLLVDYTDHDRAAYELVRRLAGLRRGRRAGAGAARRRADVVTLLLKKRLYSSPAAFARTVDVVATGRTNNSQQGDDWPASFLDELDELDLLDDEERTEVEDSALRRAGSGGGAHDGPPQDEREQEDAILAEMAAWARPYAARPDAKARALIGYLQAVCRPDGTLWTNERVVVFTEYRDTQTWLEEMLRQEGMTTGGRVALLHGGMPGDERERLRQEFQADPSLTPVRILLATDAAAEGIDLHWHCHRVVNYDIPFNPNRLEQRIGRIDRYGQRHTPTVVHFLATGWEGGRHHSDGFEGDLDFLFRIAVKVAQVEQDLGAVNPVLADGVMRAMLGERVDPDALQVPARARRLASDADVRAQVTRLREQLDATVAELGITPDRIRRLVSTALRLARQAPLTRGYDPDEVYDVPPLTGTWVRATASLASPLDPQTGRPVTFDADVARRRREDVVYAHLGHPLVAMARRLLTATTSEQGSDLSRFTAVVGEHPDLGETLVVAYARLLVVGGDGVRLHEEVVHAGGWLRGGQRFVRVENLSLLADVAERALRADQIVSDPVHRRIEQAWPGALPGITAAVEWRTRTRRQQVDQRLARRRDDELRRSRENFERFSRTLQDALTEPDQPMLPLTEPAEAAQLERDQAAWRDRLGALAAEEHAEATRIAGRYESLQEHTFPLAVVVIVPRTEAIR